MPSLQTLLLIHVVVSGSNFGIATLQHVLAVHAGSVAGPDEPVHFPVSGSTASALGTNLAHEAGVPPGSIALQ